ncbi:MAG: hypothetical protein AAGA55_02350 [Planctomycetota bacterium]
MPDPSPRTLNNEEPEQHTFALSTGVALVLATAVIAGVGCAFLGPGDSAIVRISALLSVWFGAGWMPLAYLAGAAGWGLFAADRIAGSVASADRHAIGVGIGLSLTLSATHGLGALGVLNPASAWSLTGLGLAAGGIALVRMSRASKQTVGAPRVDRWVIVLLAAGSVGGGVMLAGSAMPPGGQWDSEFGGYDSLSYHLQLPTEWMAAGRISPFAHNVYSYLPGYMESATFHMACLNSTPAIGPGGLSGLVSGTASGVFAPNLLALGFAVLGAWLIARLVLALLSTFGTEGTTAHRAAALAAALSLLTPWIQAVGSMAYNETGVVALGSAALLASTTRGLGPIRRGAIVAVLMGGAAGCKPTAVILLAPTCAIFMATTAAPKQWMSMFATGAVVGMFMLAPWLARNAIHGGNPVFPQATGLFGTAHWSPEQTATYRGGHSFDGSWSDRASMLARPDPSTDPGASAVTRFRGLTNPQWSLTPWLGISGAAVLLTRRRSRKTGLLLLLGIGTALVGWMVATHLQSRFLIPLAPMFCAAFGVGFGSIVSAGSSWSRNTWSLAAMLLLASAGWSVAHFAGQRNGRPNDLLGVGAALFTGQADFGPISDSIPSAWINRGPIEGTVLLVGDAAPLYFRRPVVYATVWDRNPLGDAIRRDPTDPDTWIEELRSGGIGWVYISFAELDRLIESRWSDPAISVDRIGQLVDRLGDPERVWDASGSALFALPTPADEQD